MQKKKQGKSSLEGNQSRAFLKLADKLEQAFHNAGGEVIVRGLPYIASLRCFNKVVEQCFQVELKEEYKASIRDFEKKYRELGVTITPKVKQTVKLYQINIFFYKVHMVFCHIVDFLELKSEAAGKHWFIFHKTTKKKLY